jgi:hypothetical protein
MRFGQRGGFSFLGKKFGVIYRLNLFFGQESRSGRGSDTDQTDVIRAEIPRILRELDVASLLDLPCGDLNWISKTDLGNIRYTGMDVVPQLISKLERDFRGTDKFFRLADITAEVPSGKFDAILCRDLLVHLSTTEIIRALVNLKATGARYLITTHFSEKRTYKELTSLPFVVGWRPINFMESPFDFPPPIATINENCTESGGRFSDKCLGVWDLQDLSVSGQIYSL